MTPKQRRCNHEQLSRFPAPKMRRIGPHRHPRGAVGARHRQRHRRIGRWRLLLHAGKHRPVRVLRTLGHGCGLRTRSRGAAMSLDARIVTRADHDLYPTPKLCAPCSASSNSTPPSGSRPAVTVPSAIRTGPASEDGPIGAGDAQALPAGLLSHVPGIGVLEPRLVGGERKFVRDRYGFSQEVVSSPERVRSCGSAGLSLAVRALRRIKVCPRARTPGRSTARLAPSRAR